MTSAVMITASSVGITNWEVAAGRLHDFSSPLLSYIIACTFI